MICPKCHHSDSKVLDSRSVRLGIRRRRQCEKCHSRFSTIEEVQILDLYVLKRNHTTELFSEKKLENGIRKAFNKRKIDEQEIKLILHSIIEDIISIDKSPITSLEIGDLVLKNLKMNDEAAYICFWAMFGNFETVDDFTKLLNDF
jgi:transcriptional repressor NrdR